MADWKGIVKNGWHPEKGGTSLRGQVKGLIGRGDTSTGEREHHATPITSLRDPSSFGPPPKHVATTGSGGVTAYNAQQHQELVVEEPPREPKPYRVDTTGLSTSHLPPPPVRRDGAVPGIGQPSASTSAPPPSYSSAKPSAPPSLPPRLPPRSNNASPIRAQSPAPTTTSSGKSAGHLNQGAVNRLGAAGISVPGLGIGKAAPPLPPARTSPTSAGSPTTTAATSGQISELQSRFSRMGTTQPQGASTTKSPGQGTTWAQKQAALRTASSFQKDPSSVSLADAKTAAGTANDFRQRHGGEVASGLRTANGLGQRFAGGGGEATPGGQNSGLVGKKKPAPPPPKKPAELPGRVTDSDVPPPVPIATRPKFT
ncbi:hypothetical protein F4778DRAFT_778636 [Xylariomycetidae sp. FL2044]|nr:hypothetical protein F4778DRAFT_778636 [Xylariomycetidae sp. FL2044]